MNQMQINVIGFLILAALFYYFQIYRPRKSMSNPNDLEVKKQPQQQLKLTDIASRYFSEKYYVLNQMSFDDLLYSPRLNRNNAFKKHLSTMKCDVVLIDKRNQIPAITIQLSTEHNDKKEVYINNAGLGCLYFVSLDDESEVVRIIQDALDSIENEKLLDCRVSRTA